MILILARKGREIIHGDNLHNMASCYHSTLFPYHKQSHADHILKCFHLSTTFFFFFSLPRSISFHPKYIKYLLLTATTDVLVFILTKLVIVDWPNCFNNWSEVITRMSVDPTTSNNQTNNQELSNLSLQIDETSSSNVERKKRPLNLIPSLPPELPNARDSTSDNMIYIGEEFTEHLEQLEEMEDCFQLINEIFEIIQQREVYDNPEFEVVAKRLTLLRIEIENLVYSERNSTNPNQ